VADGSKVRELRAHTYSASDAVFSPDGTEILTTSYDKTAMIWDAQQGGPTATLRGHDAYISHGVWIDRDHIVTNDWKGVLMLWSRGADGRFGSSATCKWNAITESIGLALSPDRKWLSATGSSSKDGNDGGIWTWPL